MGRAASGGAAPKDLTVKAWSYSAFDFHRRCPFAFKLERLEKRAVPTSPPMERGVMIGRLAEGYVRGDIPELPEELGRFPKEFAELRRLGAVPEDQWAFRADWSECEWFAKDCWVRMKIDAYLIPEARVLRVIDYKTGKLRSTEENQQQLELYAVGGMSRFDVDRVITELWYLDQGEIIGGADDPAGTFTIDQLPALQKTWEQRVRPLFADRRFSPRPGFYCRWCHFRKENGGPCQF